MFEVKDSGKRQEFETGAVRDVRDGKGRYDLISPYALKRLAIIYERGALKYGDDNYLKGMPHRDVECCCHHANAGVSS
jgi:hypothetical protein